MLSFPPGCSRLARLFLRRVGRVSFGFSLPSDAFSALEVIHLHSVRSIDLDHLLSASPPLRTLDLRYKPSSLMIKMPFENEKVEEDMISEELSEDDSSNEELSEAKVPKEVTVEELSEGDLMLSGAKISEVKPSVKQPSEDELSEGVLSDAQVSEVKPQVKEPSEEELSGAEASEKDGLSEEELQLDDVESHVLENDLKNLLVKMVNFHGHQNEMKLVSSLLRKAASLNKLLLVAPRGTKEKSSKRIGWINSIP
uniref:Uncharacterized protein n=1 Tax=Arundo donax TaxID=35708 RepID=A0A0A9KT20_ARUDO